MVVWGNHSSAQFPDARHARVRGRPAAEAVGDPAWLTGELIARVQQRGQAIMQVRRRQLRQLPAGGRPCA